MDQPEDDRAGLLAGLRADFLDTARDRVDLIVDTASRLGIAADPLAALPPLIREAHSLKSGGGTFGCPSLGEAAGEVERLAGQLLAGGRPLADASPLRAAVERLRETLSDIKR